MSRYSRSWGFRTLLFVLPIALFACGGEDRGDGDAGSISGRDGSTSGRDGALPPPPEPCEVALPVDLLFVVDNSHSMEQEQNNLAANFEDLITALTNPVDRDGDGEPDIPAVDDLRVAVVTSDMGVGRDDVPGCNAEGDRGIMRSRSSAPGCDDVDLGDEPWLTLGDGDDPTELARRFSCLAKLGTGGCGLEQQLESALAALTTRSAPGEPNEGFLRPNSLVGIVFVTDEDDCSASDTSIYDPRPMSPLGSYGTRCAEHPELLHPVSRYINAFQGLRLDRANDVVIAAITGMPFQTVPPVDIDYTALLSHPEMQNREDETNPGLLVPACRTPGTGAATPARRIIEVVGAFSSTRDGIATTICQEDLSGAMSSIADLVSSRLCGPLI